MGDEGREVQEQVPPEVAEDKPWAGSTLTRSPSREGVPRPPLHFLSSVLTILFDGLWSVPETIAAISVVGLPLVPFLAAASGLTCAVAVVMVQRLVSREDWGSALLKGLGVGLLAGLPIPLTGAAAGAFMLIWSGVHVVWGQPAVPPN